MPTAGATGSNPPRAADLLSPSPATLQVRAPQTRMTRTELVSRETQAGGRQAQAPFLVWHEESPYPGVTSRLLQAGCCVVAQLLRQYRPLEHTGAVAPQPTLCRRGVGPARGDTFLSRAPGPGTPLRGARCHCRLQSPSLTGLRCYSLTPWGAQCPLQTAGGSHQGPGSPASSTL